MRKSIILTLVLIFSFSLTAYALPFDPSSFDDNYSNYNTYENALCSIDVISALPQDIDNINRVVYLYDGTDYYYISPNNHSAYWTDLLWSFSRMSLMYKDETSHPDYRIYKYSIDGYLQIAGYSWVDSVYNDSGQYMGHITSDNKIKSFCVAGINGVLSDYGGLYINNSNSPTGYSNIIINDEGSLVLDGEELIGDSGGTGGSGDGETIGFLGNLLETLLTPLTAIWELIQVIINFLKNLVDMFMRVSDKLPEFQAGLDSLFGENGAILNLVSGFFANNEYGQSIMGVYMLFIVSSTVTLVINFGRLKTRGGA